MTRELATRRPCALNACMTFQYGYAFNPLSLYGCEYSPQKLPKVINSHTLPSPLSPFPIASCINPVVPNLLEPSWFSLQLSLPPIPLHLFNSQFLQFRFVQISLFERPHIRPIPGVRGW